MSQVIESKSHGYTQGHSDSTLATHLLRTAESDAAFLLPHIQKHHQLLDIGCGPGTITVGFAKYASEGRVVGVDISAEVLQKAKTVAAQANAPTQGAGSVSFEQANVLERLPFADGTFDVIYCGQLFGHFPPPDQPLKALAEVRRVLKSGGLLGTRTGMAQHFYPPSLDLDRLWIQNQNRVFMGKNTSGEDPTWVSMPSLLRRSGFDADGGKVEIGVGSKAVTGPEGRRWLAKRGAGQLRKGDPARQSWLDAGISEDQIEEILIAVNKWAETQDAWWVNLLCETLAWK